MKKIAAIVLLVMIVLNAMVFLPASEAGKETVKKHCSLIKSSKIDLTEVSPGILPNLMKS